MNKFLFEKFTSKILTTGPILQFILIVVCNNVHYYSSNDPDYTLLFILINLIGVIATSAWYYSIAYVANFHINEKGKVFNHLKLLEICIISSFILKVCDMFLGLETATINLSGINFTYKEPFIFSFLYLTSGIYSLIYISKILIYSETHKDVGFSGYYKTALLLIFPIIGIWLIKSRLEKLKFSEIIDENDTKEVNPIEYDPNKIIDAITDEKTLTKTEYKCNEGVIAIYQEYTNPNNGEKVFLNNKRAADGKYKIGFMNYITVKDGCIKL